MKDTIIIMRYSHGAIGLTGWGFFVVVVLAFLISIYGSILR